MVCSPEKFPLKVYTVYTNKCNVRTVRQIENRKPTQSLHKVYTKYTRILAQKPCFSEICAKCCSLPCGAKSRNPQVGSVHALGYVEAVGEEDFVSLADESVSLADESISLADGFVSLADCVRVYLV